MKKPLEVLLIGAGGRGTYAYAPYALMHPDEIQITAVADPDPERRARFAAMHEIEPERQFVSWEDAMGKGQLAPALINCTQDQMHVSSTLAALNTGYDVLLEKPMAPTPAECRLLVDTAERLSRKLQICHVLRYTKFFSKLHEIVTSGRLGRIVTIDHRENVSYWHMSHSFVRGNWRNEAQSSPMILAKCCHDMDILVWIMGRQVTKLSSFGSLTHYRPESAPPGVPKHCTDGCPIAETCPWYAPRLYGAAPEASNVNTWMVGAMGGGDTPAQRLERLKASPYNRCVYHCDNDVVDHQVINMLFDDDTTCTFTMHGHSDSEGRSMRYDGTRATLFGDFFDTQTIRIREHGSNHEELIDLTDNESGHGGGDEGIMRDFVRAMRGEPSPHTTSARVSLESHLLCFAAEQARHDARVIDMADYRA